MEMFGNDKRQYLNKIPLMTGAKEMFGNETDII
jgi:hypothetical protein